MIETRRRVINDVGTLRQIAHTLGIPVHALGVTEADDATFAAMMQFAGSVLSLAEIARKSGHAADAVNELWPLVARLESRAAEGLIERESLAVLGRARLSLGVALGTLLPEEKLTSAAKWTGRALIVAEHLDEPAFTAEALTMHGNELRKAGRIPAAIIRLRHAIARTSDASTGATASAMLARAAGEAGKSALFDETMSEYRRNLDRAPDSGMLANEFTFREVHLRGLASTGRAARAIEVLRSSEATASPAAPQWAAIERITAAGVLLAVHEREEAEAALSTGLRHAQSGRLPHQIQRAVRIAATYKLDAVADAGRTIVTRLANLVASR
jgi:tetratricopeptide (TPR) repeat protein